MTGTERPKATFGLDENVASLICYVLTWITGIIMYLVEKENNTVKFHAIQSIVTFLPLTILYWFVGYIFWWSGIGYFLSMIIGLAMFILWIVLMIKAYQGEKFKLPVAGDIAGNMTK